MHGYRKWVEKIPLEIQNFIDEEYDSNFVTNLPIFINLYIGTPNGNV